VNEPFTAFTMKTAHDLVLAAKTRCTEVPIQEAPATVLAADVVIDVREPDEYATGHLAGAINIPRGVLEFKLSGTPALEKRDLNVVLYCKTSGRAALAAVAMQSMGYLNVVSVAGGYEAWVAAGQPVVKPTPPVFE
jgi:rhodanese-related sulfurtransferase